MQQAWQQVRTVDARCCPLPAARPQVSKRSMARTAGIKKGFRLLQVDGLRMQELGKTPAIHYSCCMSLGLSCFSFLADSSQIAGLIRRVEHWLAMPSGATADSECIIVHAANMDRPPT